MKKHVMSITYPPKIEAVKNGECRQIIRPGGRFSVDDRIMIHGWVNRPYQSKWSWRINVEVTEVYNIQVHDRGIHDHEDEFVAWDSGRMDRLAERDYIYPPVGVPVGIELSHVLLDISGLDHFTGEEYQVVRWEVIE